VTLELQATAPGHVLRTALSLSLVTGQRFLLRLNGGEGLRPRHLAYVRAAEALGGRAEGTAVGNTSLGFEPSTVKSGEYVVDVGAGVSATLVWECLFYPLALAGGGELTIKGGTHLSHAPSYPYLRWVWLAGAAAFGFRAALFLKQAGFGPEGRGEFRGVVAPVVAEPDGVTLTSRGALRDVEVTSFVAGHPLELAERQAREAVTALREQGVYCSAENMPLPAGGGVGSAVFIRAQFEHALAGFTALGERGRRPEEAGRAAAQALKDFLASEGAIDGHLAARLILPAGLLAAGRLGTKRGATRIKTNEVLDEAQDIAQVVRQFLGVQIAFDQATGEISVTK
jgi:RNA 3'-terminal phosphate cyclase (ATP)